jgi:hypothetical protein
MQEFLFQIISNPFTIVKIVLALWAAFGSIMFFWGFCGYFLSHGHIGHQDHARAQMIWGTILTGSVILVWEGIRFLVGMFTGASYTSAGIFFGVLAVIFILYALWMLFMGKPKGGH